jgi:DNA polymerase-1
VIADYSQMELRIAAEISKDQTMLNAYSNGIDLHRLTASIITGKSIEKITKDERQAAKVVNFGLIFGMGAEGLMNYAREKYSVQMTIQEANDFRSRFLTAYKGIDTWQKRTGNTLCQETRTLGNRRRIWAAPAPLTELLNTPIQGTAADIVKKALCLLPERLKYTKAKLVGCVHDEIILEAPELNAEKASNILEETMIEAGKCYLKKIPVEVEVSVADSWAGKK